MQWYYFLQLYNFGEAVSIVFWTDTWRPDSFYDKIAANRERRMHTLCLLGKYHQYCWAKTVVCMTLQSVNLSIMMPIWCCYLKLQHQLIMPAVRCIEQKKFSAVCSPGCQPLNQSDAEWFIFYVCMHSPMHLICMHAYMSRCAWVYLGVHFEGPEQCVSLSLNMLLFFVFYFFLMEQQYCICTSCSVLIDLISELVLSSQSIS